MPLSQCPVITGYPSGVYYLSTALTLISLPLLPSLLPSCTRQILNDAIKRYTPGSANRWQSISYYVNDKVRQHSDACSILEEMDCPFRDHPFISLHLTLIETLT
jgi:hypothetical protein